MPKFNKFFIKKSLLLLSLATAVSFFDSTPADNAQEEYTVKSLLSLNFARFTDWPEDIINAQSPSINLCVAGDDLIQQTFALIDKKQVGERFLSVIELTGSTDLPPCQLLYISVQDKNLTRKLLSECVTKHILTIGDDDQFIKDGGMVYLQLVDGQIKLNINLNVVKQAGLTISSRVLKLATIINP
ncbi:MAG: YfiR family protein [Methylococcaceae bacterium]